MSHRIKSDAEYLMEARIELADYLGVPIGDLFPEPRAADRILHGNIMADMMRKTLHDSLQQMRANAEIPYLKCDLRSTEQREP